MSIVFDKTTKKKERTSLVLATFNTFTATPEPIRFNSQRDRLIRMTPALKTLEDGRVDVFALTEAMVNSVEQDLLDPLAEAGWIYQTRNLLPDNPIDLNLSNSTSFLPVLVCGGVFIVSRWPITREARCIFEHTMGADSLSAKGVVYACVRKNNRNFHILATHLQAWSTEESRRIRALQIAEIHEFLQELNVPANEPLLLAGDLNMDRYQDFEEWNAAAQHLSLQLPLIRGPIRHSMSTKNQWAGLDDPTEYRSEQWPQGCYQETIGTLHCTCCSGTLVDYCCYSSIHQRPYESYLTIQPLRVAPYSAQITFGNRRDIEYLSDHSVVLGHFFFDEVEVDTTNTTSENKTTTEKYTPPQCVRGSSSGVRRRRLKLLTYVFLTCILVWAIWVLKRWYQL